MTSSHPDKDLIAERQAKYAEAYNTADVEKILSFMSNDISFSDYGVGMININKPAVRTYFTNMYTSCANLKLETVSINGHKNFTTWEWNLTFNYVKAAPEAAGEAEFGADMADGRLMRMIGVSVSWWNVEGKIVKNHDYAKVVDEFEVR